MATIKFSNAMMRDGWICLRPSDSADRANAAAVVFDATDGKKRLYVAEIKRHSPKRSLSANAYAWSLINEIGNVLRRDKDEIYFEMLKRYGQGGSVCVKSDCADSWRRVWKYHEDIGQSEINGEMYNNFRFWIGTSAYNTREMSIFIDGVVDEAQALGIETATPEELALIKER